MAIDVNTAAIINSINLNFNLGATVGMAFDPTTGLAWVGDGGENATNSLYTLNIGNGTLDLVGAIGFPSGIAGLTFVTVPEPSSIVLLGIPAMIYMIARRSLTAAFVRGFILPTWRPSCSE